MANRTIQVVGQHNQILVQFTKHYTFTNKQAENELVKRVFKDVTHELDPSRFYVKIYDDDGNLVRTVM